MSNLHRLYDELGQSPWLDNLTRDDIQTGRLAAYIASGVRGITANPTIIAKAIAGSAAYDDQIFELVRNRVSAAEAMWELAISDVQAAADALRPVHEASAGNDGFVSLEVSPDLSDDSTETVAAVDWLVSRVGRRNLLVKIPATAAGIDAIRVATAAGHSINVTLIFSLDRYAEVIDAYLTGLEAFVAGGGDAGSVRSVASFFVSRVDAEVERRLSELAGPLPASRKGTVAIAQAKLAFELFRNAFSSERWARLAARGAKAQRPLWASTSTKDPSLPDTLYVDSLIGPETVITLPETTIAAFNDHGALRRTLDTDIDGARNTIEAVAAAGVDLGDVGRVLEERGIQSFVTSVADVVRVIGDRMGRADDGAVA